MSDAIGFLMILPVLMLGIVLLDAAGTLGSASHRTATFAESAAVHAADVLSRSPAQGADPSVRARWEEVASTVDQAGLAATAGVCKQTDPVFDVQLISQPRPAQEPNAYSSVAVTVSCPVDLGQLLSTTRVVAASVEPLR